MELCISFTNSSRWAWGPCFACIWSKAALKSTSRDENLWNQNRCVFHGNVRYLIIDITDRGNKGIIQHVLCIISITSNDFSNAQIYVRHICRVLSALYHMRILSIFINAGFPPPIVNLQRLPLSDMLRTCAFGAGHPLTHWGRDKMAAISQTTLSNPFSWMKMFEFRLKFHWSWFPRVQLTIFQHWFR